jgi:putative ABC transport system substrate-binding protein
MTLPAMHRRSALGAIGALIATPAFAQLAKPIIGVLMVVNADPDVYLKSLREGLRERGYVDGQNIFVEVFRAKPDQGDLATLAAAMVARKVNVIVAIYTQAALAAKSATSDIPVVAYTGDMVASGIVASLAKPGGNITGVTGISPEVSALRLDILRQIVLSLRRFALLLNETDPLHKVFHDHYELAGKKLGVETLPFKVCAGDAFEPAFTAISQAKVDAMWVQPSLLRNEIAQLIQNSGIPTIGDTRWMVDNGGVFSYGADEEKLKRQLADFVDRILKGTKPADLPIQQPVKFDLTLNLKRIKALSLNAPPFVIAQADEVIE